MKHLHGRFKEDLSGEDSLFVADGVVHIRSRFWTAADIIDLFKHANGSNPVFDELFSDWIDERRQQNIELADEILEMYGLQDRFRRLSEIYKKGRVIPFVGAGLSIPSGYPGWTQFLRKVRRHTSIAESVLDGLLDAGNYEEAAQLIADDQGVSFNESVDSAFGCSRELSGPVALIPYVFSGCVVTTNFDDLLERAFELAENKITEKLSGSSSAEIRRRLQSDNLFLLKLHGTATSGTGRILTLNEYEANYVGDSTLKKTVQALCNSGSLLFLGCSLTFDRTIAAVQEHVNQEGHDNLPKHYAFLADPGDDAERISRQRKLAEAHIYPIWYPQNSHNESIEALLTKLLEACR